MDILIGIFKIALMGALMIVAGIVVFTIYVAQPETIERFFRRLFRAIQR